MPTVSAARGCSPQARIRRPIAVLKRAMYERITSANPAQIMMLRLPIDSPRKLEPLKPRWTFGIVETPEET
jgi:hypothetical protein